MSIGELLDREFFRQSPMTTWGVPIIIGLMLVWSSTFVEIDNIYAPPIDMRGHEADCYSGGKQVGLWTSFNWSIVFICLFPIYLICCWVLSRTTRQAIDDAISRGLIKDAAGKLPPKAAIHELLTEELRSNNYLFIILILAVILLALGSWWLSCGKALLAFKLDREVVDWSTVVIACNLRYLQYPVLVYTLVAYIWMGIALFVYLSCLFLGFIYASFWSKLALISEDGGHPAGEGDHQGPLCYFLYLEPSIFKRYAGQFLVTYFLACTFGLLAGYLMRFQSLYLLTSNTSISDYIIDMYHALWGAVTPPPEQTVFQRADASNQTLFWA